MLQGGSIWGSLGPLLATRWTLLGTWEATEVCISPLLLYDSLHFVAGQKKRAIYESVIRNRLHPFLTAFNYPVPLSTVSRRPSNNVPAQALSLMNGLAEDLSGNLSSQVNVKRDVDVVLRELFLRFYAREITASDRTLCQNFLGENPGAEDWRRLIATLFNSKELIYVY